MKKVKYHPRIRKLIDLDLIYSLSIIVFEHNRRLLHKTGAEMQQHGKKIGNQKLGITNPIQFISYSKHLPEK